MKSMLKTIQLLFSAELCAQCGRFIQCLHACLCYVSVADMKTIEKISMMKTHKSWGATWIGSPLGTSGVDGFGIMEQRVSLN